MRLAYRLLADLVLVVHVSYVAFVVLGLVLVLAGYVRKWLWVRNFWFRAGHLLAIAIVVAESWWEITCPLTVWESRLRRAAGDSGYQGDFIANWLHELLFIDATPQTLTILYSLFGGLVVLTLCLVPPRIPRRFRTTQPG
jgi:hypothetical protein